MEKSQLLLDAANIIDELTGANEAFTQTFPGDLNTRQPIHTVYGGAHLFKAETPKKLATIALKSLETYAPTPFSLAKILKLAGWERWVKISSEEEISLTQEALAPNSDLYKSDFQAWLACAVYARTKEKLSAEAIEDFRIDFEDGYGNRTNLEEDQDAIRSAKELARGLEQNTLPPYMGIRIKALHEETKARAIKTLDLFVSTLVDATGGKLPNNFLVTLPKVSIPEQVKALKRLFELLEARLDLPKKSFKMEIMVESPQAIFNRAGQINLPQLLSAASGRCVAMHFGTYDYTADCNVIAKYQTMAHPLCDFARNMMLNTLSGTGVFLSDGATNVMPVGPHKPQDAKPLTAQHMEENRAVVHAAWKLGYDHIRNSLAGGLYQGWDLHPAQLPIRYAASYTFFLESLEQSAQRLHHFMEQAAQASLLEGVFDDAASAQGLLNYFLKALNCGAISPKEVSMAGLTMEELKTRSFLKILDRRRQKGREQIEH
ncbi:MAG: phosphoenolpyruvate kinase [Myxococcota bacterium]|nr:phosphoenolpyruvate kinase [Myxococcota bacterium]